MKKYLQLEWKINKNNNDSFNRNEHRKIGESLKVGISRSFLLKPVGHAVEDKILNILGAKFTQITST